ncbi:hypothetical protein [Streptomyces eurythermus]|uniref:hypothetical protein n=1 Tax=Streptomyces eurythermus TaxID=42237 RepID=UPI0036FFD6DC
MGRSTLRRRRVKQPSGRFTSKRSGRNKKFRYVNRSGTHAVAAFIGILFSGYLLISRPAVQVTVTIDAVPAAASGLAVAVLCYVRMVRSRC